eukprot:jgi/Psemu1/283500/fgenesh1_pg.28_\
MMSKVLCFLSIVPLILSSFAAGSKWANNNNNNNNIYRPRGVVAFVGSFGGTGTARSSLSKAFVGRFSAAKESIADAETTPPEETVRGPVLLPSPSATAFDSACVANPVVLPPRKTTSTTTGSEKWQMYYYGNPGSWANNTKGFLPTGYVGLAESTDGIHWEKIAGKEDYGSILAPTGRDEDFDGLHLGVGDVVRVGEDEDELHMYYFGGSFEGISIGGPNMPPSRGLRMRIGKARSTDGGRSWEKMGQVLDYDPSEGLFASWPRIILPENESDDQPWRMLYHAFNGTRWAVFEATSSDRGETWKRGDGEMAIGPGDPDGWDGSGVGTRAVVRTGEGQLVMVYEAVSGAGGAFGGRHRFGLARWEESGDSGVWVKDTAITGVPGGPILDGGVAPLEPWTSHVIGTPYLVAAEDGSMRLYYCSKKNNDMSMSIGLVESVSGQFDPSYWTAISP